MNHRIYRSRKESLIAGVCGGLGEYFDIDPVIIRLIFVLLIFAGGAGLIGYIIAWIIIPQAPATGTAESAEVPPPPAQGEAPSTPAAERREKGAYLTGLILIVIGGVFLFSNLFHWFEFWELWPVILIVIGAVIVIKAKGSKDEDPASA